MLSRSIESQFVMGVGLRNKALVTLRNAKSGSQIRHSLSLFPVRSGAYRVILILPFLFHLKAHSLIVAWRF